MEEEWNKSNLIIVRTYTMRERHHVSHSDAILADVGATVTSSIVMQKLLWRHLLLGKNDWDVIYWYAKDNSLLIY